MMFPVSSSQKIPCHEVGHSLKSLMVERFHELRTRSSGSEVMPFLNSSRDRSSGKEAEQVVVSKMKNKCAAAERKMVGRGVIGVNVDENGRK